jgi:hypothetical protein
MVLKISTSAFGSDERLLLAVFRLMRWTAFGRLLSVAKGCKRPKAVVTFSFLLKN